MEWEFQECQQIVDTHRGNRLFRAVTELFIFL